MADDTGQEPTTTTEGASSGQTPPTSPSPIAPAQSTPSPTPAASADGDEFDKDRALATIRKLREFEKTAKAQTKELEELRARVQAEEDAKLSEQEKVQKRLQELEARLAETETEKSKREAELLSERRRGKVIAAAVTANALDPADANILAATAQIDPSGEKADEEITAALTALKEKKPYLFRAQGNRTLEAFNPGAATGVSETDQQRLVRLQRLRTGGRGPLG